MTKSDEHLESSQTSRRTTRELSWIGYQYYYGEPRVCFEKKAELINAFIEAQQLKRVEVQSRGLEEKGGGFEKRYPKTDVEGSS